MMANGQRKARVTSLGNVTAAATWSPDGKTIAFSAGGPVGQVCQYYSCQQPVYTSKSTAPFGNPTPLLGYDTCGDSGSPGCSDGDPSAVQPIVTDQLLAWSPDGRIAIFNHNDGAFDDAIWMYYIATKETRQYLVFGGDCCGYADFSDFAWGPTGQFGLGENLDEGFGNETDYVEKLVYPADQCRIYREFADCPPAAGPVFVAAVGDKSPAPSPTNAHMAFVNASSGTPKVYVSTIAGAQRKVIVTNGYQPDWQPLP
jgi:hypothetical protein